MMQRADAGAPSKETGALARNVDSALEAVEDIFSALLEMSRLDAGAMKVELSSFPVSDLFDQLKIEFAPLAEKKQLKLTFVPCSLAVRSDRRLLRRLLQNLVSNAIKYTRSGRVLVGARRLRGKVRIEVWDTGLGIPPEKQKSVFREFERLDAGAAEPGPRPRPVHRRAHGARARPSAVFAARLPGKGSVFTVTAPLARAGAAGRRPATPSAAAPRQSPLAGMVVVAIDNDRSIVDGMRALLSSWGCVPIVAASQREALEELARQNRTPGRRPRRLSPRRGRRRGRRRRLALAFRRFPSRRPGHRRPLGGDADAGAGKGRDGDQQAAQASGAARPAGAVAGRRRDFDAGLTPSSGGLASKASTSA